MGYRLDLPHTHCAGYSTPGGRDYQADPKRPGTVVIDNARDAALAARALGQKLHSEGSIVRLSTTNAETWECACGRENWAWVEVCSRCSTHRDSGLRAA